VLGISTAPLAEWASGILLHVLFAVHGRERRVAHVRIAAIVPGAAVDADTRIAPDDVVPRIPIEAVIATERGTPADGPTEGKGPSNAAADPIVTVVTVDHVIAASSVEQVIARTTPQEVGPTPSEDLVISQPAIELILPCHRGFYFYRAGSSTAATKPEAPADPVIAIVPPDLVVPGLTEQVIVIRAALDDIITRASPDVVRAMIPDQEIMAIPTEDQVIARPRIDLVISPKPTDNVVPL
jgi:hypothetical protein